MQAADVMEKHVMSVSPDLPLDRFKDFLTEGDISGAPVVGLDGRILGIASKTDVIRAQSGQAISEVGETLGNVVTVEDIMTPDPVTVSPKEDLRTLARKMIDGHLHRVLVVEDDAVIGIVTTFDLLQVFDEAR